MRKQTKNTIFMIAVIVILIGSLVTLGVLTKKQEKANEANQPENYDSKDYKVDGLSLDKQPTIGKEDAPVTMVVFSDFSCPHCKIFDKTVLPKIKSELVDTGKVKLKFMNFAFINASSTVAASASEAVYKQNPKEFYKFYRGVYDLQPATESNTTWANSTSLTNLAKKLKLDIDYTQFEKDIKSNKYSDAANQDRAEGEAIGVQGTPALIIDNTFVDPTDYNAIKKQVNSLAKKEAKSNE
ncbi:hypothetical protein CN918_27205 [Priestia megaterium]|nr:hypothetical protein CN918_27205 [Priestia megaterium]